MKKNIFIKGFAAAALVATMASCSGDYLDLEPITSIDSSTVTNSVKGARYGLYGVCRTMWWPEENFGISQRFISGEASINTFYADVMSPDAMYQVFAPYGVNLFNWSYMRTADYWFCSLSWRYYYNLIAMCNRILDDIDDAEGDPNERDFIKAQLLTIRAHSYQRMLLVYAPRWEDSNNGNAYCLVLRTNFSTQDVPLSTMNQVNAQIYADLDQAIALYQSCGQKRTRGWEPDINVAYGVYARAAATIHDWAKCRDMARLARNGHPIMSAQDYQAGFADANGEWMWYNAPDDEMLGYWCWGGMYACNGSYVSFWGQYGAGSINYDLIRQLKRGDIRSTMYLVPENAPTASTMPKKADFFNKSKVDPTNVNVNYRDAKLKSFVSLFGQSKVPGGDVATWGLPYQVANEQGAADEIMVPFGAQYKFWAHGTYSVSSFPWMRGAEFALLEAEACYRLNDEPGARTALIDVNSQRFTTEYTCTASGEDLWNEIMLTSRIELWGEGHSWYNFKRWNIPLERKVWEAGNTSSNNFPSLFKAEYPTNMMKGWTYIIPVSETRYNHAIDMNLVR